MALQLDSSEQVRIQMAQSAETMAGTAFWKALVKALAVDESNSLVSLDDYLTNERHPDREEVITLCINWHTYRRILRTMLENVSQARDYKAVLQNRLLEQFMADPQQPVSEDVQSILLEYGEM